MENAGRVLAAVVQQEIKRAFMFDPLGLHVGIPASLDDSPSQPSQGAGQGFLFFGPDCDLRSTMNASCAETRLGVKRSKVNDTQANAPDENQVASRTDASAARQLVAHVKQRG